MNRFAGVAVIVLIQAGMAVPATAGDLPDFDRMWDYSDPAGTETAFRELLPAAEESADRSYHLQLLTQIARTLGLQQRFDEAHQMLDQVESSLRPGMDVVLVRSQLERGRAFNSSDRPDQARELFRGAYRLARRKRLDFYAIDAAHMMGIVQKGDESILWNHTALEIAERADEDRARKWAGSLYNNLGWTYHDSGDFEGALDLFEKALQFRVARGKEDETSIARWCVARCLRSLSRVEEALAMQRSLLVRAEETGEKDGYVFEELGECLLLLNRPSEAAPYFRLAHEELSGDRWLTSHEPERLERLRRLGG